MAREAGAAVPRRVVGRLGIPGLCGEKPSEDLPPAWPAAPQAYCAQHSGPEACATRMICKVQIYNQMTRDAGLK